MENKLIYHTKFFNIDFTASVKDNFIEKESSIFKSILSDKILFSHAIDGSLKLSKAYLIDINMMSLEML